MSAPSPDPAKWLLDLMKMEPAALWPPVDIADSGKAVTAAATLAEPTAAARTPAKRKPAAKKA